MLNPLRHLVFLEGGAVALLATALAKHGYDQPFKSQVSFWQRFTDLCKLQLSNEGPATVEVEYDRADLLVIWDSWVIVIEAKMSSAFVRRGQLQTYYDRFRPRLGKAGMLANASSVAVIFLTPAGVGNIEFESLSIDPTDKKIHLYWPDVLSSIESSYSSPQASEDQNERFLRSLVLHGASRIRQLLTDTGPGPMGVMWTTERRRCRDFAKQVQSRIVDLCTDWNLHFNPIWSDLNGDEVSGNFGGDRAGNVYFVVHPDSTIQEDDSVPSKLMGRLYFKLALRAGAERKAQFESLYREPPSPTCVDYDVTVDYTTCTVTKAIELSQPRSQLCAEMSNLFRQYLSEFRNIMA